MFAYDSNGNIVLQEEYDYTVKPAEELGLVKVIKEYCYESFSDKLLQVITNALNANGEYEETTENFVYDAIGNPTKYRGKNATWEKNGLLTSYDGNIFTYDVSGRRLAKNTIDFTHDSQDRVVK